MSPSLTELEGEPAIGSAVVAGEDAPAADVTPLPAAAEPPAIIGRLRRLTSPGLLSQLDQAVVSGTRFLTGILVARSCGPEDLGIYSLAFAVLVMLACTQESLICRPYTVFWRKRGNDSPTYAGSVFAHHLSLSLLVTLALLCMSAWAWAMQADLLRLSTALLLAMPCVLLWEFARRACFAHLKMETALLLDSSVAALQLGSLGLLAGTGGLSASTAYLCVGGACLVGGGAWLLRNRQSYSLTLAAVPSDWKHNWRFGRWAFATQIAGVIHGYMLSWQLLFLVGTAATGLFAACQNIVLLSNPLLLGFSNLLEARSAEAAGHHGPEAVAGVVRRSLALLTVLTVLFAVALWFTAELLLMLLFGVEYVQEATAVAVMGLATIAWGWNVVLSGGLAALDRPDVGFRSAAAGLTGTAFSGLLLIPVNGVTGAAWALVIGSYVAAIWLYLSFRRVAASRSTD